MRHRAAERAFLVGPFDVDVDPLMVAGAAREFIDAVLADGDPFRGADVVADPVGQIGDGESGVAHAVAH